MELEAALVEGRVGALVESRIGALEVLLVGAGAVEPALPSVAETMTTLDTSDSVEDVTEAVSSGTVVVPLMPYTIEADIVDALANGTMVVLLAPYIMALADIVGLVANTIVELSLVMIHCVVTAGLLWKTMLEDPEGTTHSVLLLVAE